MGLKGGACGSSSGPVADRAWLAQRRGRVETSERERESDACNNNSWLSSPKPGFPLSTLRVLAGGDGLCHLLFDVVALRCCCACGLIRAFSPIRLRKSSDWNCRVECCERFSPCRWRVRRERERESFWFRAFLAGSVFLARTEGHGYMLALEGSCAVESMFRLFFESVEELPFPKNGWNEEVEEKRTE